MTKPVSGLSDQVRHKPDVQPQMVRGLNKGLHYPCSVKTKSLIGCAFISQLIFAYAKSRFSHNMAHIVFEILLLPLTKPE